MRRVRFAIRLLRWTAAGVVGLAVVVVFGLWRLSMGPIELDFARGYASRSFDTPEGRMTLEAGRVSLVWAGWREPLQLVLSQIAATSDSGVRVGTVPAVVINLSLRALAGGALQPTEIDVDNVRLDVVIRREGLIETFVPQDAESSASRILPVLMEQLLGEPDLNHPLGRLNRVRIHSARVRIDDQATGFVWDAPAARAEMVRDTAGVRLNGRLTVQAGGHHAEFELAALYGRSREQLDIELRGRNLRLAEFATAAPQLAPVAGLDLPMDGVVRLSASGGGAIRSVSLELTGGAGRVGIPGVLNPPREVDKLALRLSFTPAENSLRIETFTVGFNGPVATLSGVLALDNRAFRFEGDARVANIPISRLAEFWLEPLASGGRAWALANISHGAITSLALDVAVAGHLDRPDDLKVERSSAVMHYEDLTVRYAQGLPPLHGVSGKATFDGVLMRYTIASGQGQNMALVGGRIDLLGLDGPDNHRADLELQIRGSVPDAMSFLAQPALGLPKDLLFNPKRTGGDASIVLRLNFPLSKGLSWSEIAYSATADLARFSLQRAFAGLTLADATARLEVDERELKVAGKGKVDGQVLDVQWRELFGPKVPFRRRYEVKGLVSQATLASAGLGGVSSYLSGNVLLAPLVYQVPAAGPSELSIKADLKPARIAVPEIKWEKPAGAEGQATVTARFSGSAIPAATEFDLRLGDLAAAGRVDLHPGDGRLQRVALARLVLGRTNVSGDVRRTEAGYAIDVRGPALDVARFLEDDKQAPRAHAGAPAPPAQGPVVTVNLDVGQILLTRGVLPAVRGTLTRQGERTLAADVQLTAGTAGPTRLVLQPQAGGRQLTLRSPDVGSLLHSAGWLDGLIGGELEITARLDDSRADPPMYGRVEMRRFRMTPTAPVPGRDVGTLNGVVEQIGRAGNASQVFDRLEARIEKTGSRLVIRNGHMSGDSVGVTAQGSYELDREEICLAGAVTPAYVLNALLSNIPIIGWILTGGEGRGLFAINYSVRGPIDQPKGEANAATVITPGFLRRMMEGTCGIGGEPAGGRGAPGGRTLEQQQQDRIGH